MVTAEIKAIDLSGSNVFIYLALSLYFFQNLGHYPDNFKKCNLISLVIQTPKSHPDQSN